MQLIFIGFICFAGNAQITLLGRNVYILKISAKCCLSTYSISSVVQYPLLFRQLIAIKERLCSWLNIKKKTEFCIMPQNISDFSILNHDHNLCLNQMFKYSNVALPALEQNVASKCDPGDS